LSNKYKIIIINLYYVMKTTKKIKKFKKIQKKFSVKKYKCRTVIIIDLSTENDVHKINIE